METAQEEQISSAETMLAVAVSEKHQNSTDVEKQRYWQKRMNNRKLSKEFNETNNKVRRNLVQVKHCRAENKILLH